MNGTAAAEWRDNPKAFRDGMAWTYDRDYALRSAVGRYVSVVRSDGTFEGGAHPNQEINTILWDNTAQKRISIRPFFIETADNGPTMTALARLAQPRRRGREARQRHQRLWRRRSAGIADDAGR